MQTCMVRQYLVDKEVFAALGWLGREGKVSITETETDVTITLVG